MIIAAALSEKKINSSISEHFGRSRWYGLYDTVSGVRKYIANPNHQSLSNAGLQSAELLQQHNLSMVIAGGFGFRVAEKFKANKIQMIIPQNNQTWNEFINILKKQQ